MDSSERQKALFDKEIEKSQENRLKRENNKKIKAAQIQTYLDSLKDHSTGLITWKNNKNNSWIGYVDKQKTFNLSFGFFKYSLSLYKDIKIDDKNKKDKHIHTSFQIENLKSKAESIAQRIEESKMSIVEIPSKNNKKS